MNSLASYCKWSCSGGGNDFDFFWCACLLITHPGMFMSSSLLAFFLPPLGSHLARLLSSSDRRWSSVWFFHQSLTLLGSTEKYLAAASPVFIWIFYDRKFEFQVVLFIFFAALEPWRSSMWYRLTEGKQNIGKRRRRKTCSVSGHVFFLD